MTYKTLNIVWLCQNVSCNIRSENLENGACVRGVHPTDQLF